MILFGYTALFLGLLFVATRIRGRGFSSISVWFVLSSLVFVNAPFVMFYHSLTDPQKWRMDYGILTVSLGLVAFMVGTLVVVNRRDPNRVEDLPFSDREKLTEVQATRRLLVLSAIMFVPSWAYFAFLGYVPLFEGVSAVSSTGLDGLGELQASRLSRDPYASENGTSIPFQGVMQITRNLGVPMVAALAISQMNAGRRRGLRVAILTISVITVLLAGQRWPLIYIIIAMVAAFVASAPKKHVGKVIPLGAALGGVGVIISILQGRTQDQLGSWGGAIVFGIENLVQRILYEQSLVPMTSYINGVFERGELGGRSYWDSLTAYLPGPGASFSVEFYQTVTGDWRAYTAPPDFYTEALINFGFAGVILLSFVWGFFIRLIDGSRFSQDPEFSIALKAGLCAILASSVFTGPVFTISGLLLVLGSKFFVEWMSVRSNTPKVADPLRVGIG